MEAPLSIKREKVSGRDATVARMPNGLVKVIFDDGEVVFLVDEKLRAKKNPPPTEDSDARA
jgi:hypothetical protein